MKRWQDDLLLVMFSLGRIEAKVERIIANQELDRSRTFSSRALEWLLEFGPTALRVVLPYALAVMMWLGAVALGLFKVFARVWLG